MVVVVVAVVVVASGRGGGCGGRDGGHRRGDDDDKGPRKGLRLSITDDKTALHVRMSIWVTHSWFRYK